MPRPGPASSAGWDSKAAASVAVAVAIMAVMLWPGGLGIDMHTLNWILLVPATFIQFWAGGVFVRNAWRQARHGTVSMDTLVAMGTLAAWGYSVVVTVAPELVMEAGIEPVTYFDSSAMIIGLILTGRWLEARARSQASGAVAALVGLQARTARLVRGDVGDGRARRAHRRRRPAARAARREGARGRRHHQRHVLHRRVDAHG